MTNFASAFTEKVDFRHKMVINWRMSTVSVHIHGHDYQIACDDGQEEQLLLLSQEVDRRLGLLSEQMGGTPGEAMGLLLTALMMADELIEIKKEIKKLKLKTGDQRLLEMESAMAQTLENIAARIENIAERIEIR